MTVPWSFGWAAQKVSVFNRFALECACPMASYFGAFSKMLARTPLMPAHSVSTNLKEKSHEKPLNR